MKQQQGLAARLASIEGHVKAIKRMVDDDAYCIDVLKQTYAVERALKRFEAELLRGHLASCVPTGLRDGRRNEILAELGDVFELAQR
ncbi:MAG: metal-sensitive transcriptional regulator [Chloroflexi bacterium]|nr:MAG: metal-sensitive transcriptional regulator [Chloroflexota bacterium]